MKPSEFSRLASVSVRSEASYGYIVVDLFHFEPDLVILEKNVLIFIDFPTDGKGHLFCGRRGHLEF